jgi:diacylglycerol O-acyltransferase / wax synthase
MPTSGMSRLSGEDLTFWWADSPMQPTTMAMLMLLDRAPAPDLLRSAFERAIDAVPRLAERVAEAPFALTLPHWERDPTFDLDYHLRHHALPAGSGVEELLHEIAPAYETPFDRSRPLWEARVYDGVGPENGAALFFKLHHAVADGVGGNAIFAAMTDWQREPEPSSAPHLADGIWGETPSLMGKVAAALRDRVELDLERAGAAVGVVADAIQHPEKIGAALTAFRSLVSSMSFDSHSPLKRWAGRSRQMSGVDLPFEEVRALRRKLGGCMIDVILTVMARAIGRWHREHGVGEVDELMTLVPVNLRKPEEWADQAHVGNVATGIMLPLPIRLRTALATYREVARRMAEKKADPASAAAPALAELMSVLPRSLFSWMAQATFGSVDFIVTNVPGILVPRYLAGAEIVSAYPFAPVAVQSPVSVAIYGYRDRLFIGLNSDRTVMPDVDAFRGFILDAFEELRASAGRAGRRSRPESVASPARRRSARGRGRG